MSSNLLSEQHRKSSMTFFALGGSGVRALEPLVHLCALGLGPRQLKVVIIDPDQSNAAVARSRAIMERYIRIRQLLSRDAVPEDGYFRTEIVDVIGKTILWSPIADDSQSQDARFSVRIDRALMSGPAARLGQLYDLLYSQRIRDMDLNLGFRGVPSIGTVFMNRLREQSFFEQLLRNSRTDPDSVFFSVGSVFGGTGAAALPVVGRALVDGLKNRKDKHDLPGVDASRVGAALLLPYFTLPTPDTPEAPDGGIRPDAGLFAQNAAAAMPTYVSEREGGYGSYYVLGDNEPREQDKNEVGGVRQANRSHYIELFSALAALDFSSRGGEPREQELPVFRATAVSQSNVGWRDLPINEETRKRLIGGFVAAHSFLTIFRPDGKSQPNLHGLLNGSTWLKKLEVETRALDSRTDLFDELGAYWTDVWTWAADLGQSTPAMEMIRAPGRDPSTLRHDESILGRRAPRELSPTSVHGFEIFRHWNISAHRHAKTGFRGFMHVMREGSESFVDERFPETVNAG
jgi:hypothetical protein